MSRIGGTLFKAVLLLVGLTAFGGMIAGLLIVRTPTTYQASAYVGQLPMPADARSALGAEQAAAIDAVYQAGPLQEDVLDRVARQLTWLTSAGVRARVRLGAEPYTPLLIIIGQASQPSDAMAIANTVASTWVAELSGAYDTAFTTVETGLTTSDGTLTSAIAVTQQAIVAGTTHCGAHAQKRCASSAQLAALQTTLSTDLAQQTAVRDQITTLEIRRAQVVRVVYLAIPADADTMTSLPDVQRILEAGLAGGFTLGALLAIWLLRRPVRQILRQRMRRDGEPIRSSAASRGTAEDHSLEISQ